MKRRTAGAPEGVAKRERLLVELRRLERDLTLASIDEAIRLLESGKFELLTGGQLRCIAEYRAIAIDHETFFDKAFSTGKEVAACLAYAKELGGPEVLEDLLRLRMTLRGGAGARQASRHAVPRGRLTVSWCRPARSGT